MPPDDPLTEEELRFREHCRADNPRARSVSRGYSVWAAQCRERWALEHQAGAAKTRKHKPAKPKAPAEYNQKWQP